MKKTVSFLLAVCLLLCACAFAETAADVGSYHDVVLGRNGNILAVQYERGENYIITDIYGNKLLDEEFISATSYEGLLKVEQKTDSINDTGVVGSDGSLLVPCEYTGVEILNETWILAKHTVPCGEDNFDYRVYTNGADTFAIIDVIDVYYKGEKIGSLDRLDYYLGYPYGDYLVIKDVAGEYHGYNNRLEMSPVITESSAEYADTKENGVRVYYHVGSGQKAFCPECTLTPDEVNEALLSDNKYNFYDLQGNLVFSAGDSVTYVGKFNYGFGGDYAYFKSNTGKGIIRDDGTIVVPGQYNEVNYTYMFRNHIAVDVDGKLGYVDMNGNLVYTSPYPYANFKVDNSFSTIQDLDGSLIVTTPAGQLEQRFAYVKTYSYTGYSELAAVTATDGRTGVIDIYGNEVVPLSASYRDASYIDISNDGSVITVRNADVGGCQVFHMDINAVAPVSADESDEPAVAPADANESDEPAVAPADAEPQGEPAPAEDSWTCEVCGAANTGAFCPNDGTKKPEPQPEETAADDGSWVCEACGEACTGNFCPNDGTKKPEEPAGWFCPICGVPVESNFCPNDGTKKPE